jgi:type IV pilus assembly protein PilW
VDVTLGANTDQWADNMPAAATAIDWSRVIAIRLVVTSRSMTPEKPDTAGVCNTTTVAPKWVAPAPGAAPPGIDLNITADADWRCFRYRTFEVAVPIRNMVWFPL